MGRKRQLWPSELGDGADVSRPVLAPSFPAVGSLALLARSRSNGWRVVSAAHPALAEPGAHISGEDVGGRGEPRV